MDAPELVTIGPAGLGTRLWRAGSGRPVLLVHGLSSNARLWDEVAGHLAAAGHPVAAVDLRGHGSSAAVPDSDSDDPDSPALDPTRTAASDLAAVSRDLGWSAPVVAGHAWGGNIALQMAADHLDLVHGLALVDGGWLHLGDQWPSLDDAWAVLAPPQFTDVTADVLLASLRAGHPTWSDAAVHAVMGNLHEDEDGSVTPHLERERHRGILGSMMRHRPRTLYALIRCPVLLLAAIGPTTPPRKREQIDKAVAAIHDAEVIEFDGGDHDLHAQHPAEVAELISRLL